MSDQPNAILDPEEENQPVFEATAAEIDREYFAAPQPEDEDDADDDEEGEPDEDDIFETRAPVGNTFDPGAYIEVNMNGATPRYIPATGPMTVGEVMRAANLVANGPVDYYVGGAAIKVTDQVFPGQQLMIAGNVKGG